MNKLSIITALLDSDEQIFGTAGSVLPQLQDGVEWLIKNSSTNPSAELQRLVDSNKHIKLVAQVDGGLYDGLNQALDHATGVYFQVLGAGDHLADAAVDHMLAAIDENDNKFKMDSIYFPVYHLGYQRLLKPVPTQIHEAMNCPHPGALLKVELCKSIGGFNLGYRIASDYELIARYLKKWTGVMVGEHAVVNFAGGGMSETRGYECMLETELVKVRIFGKHPY